MPWGIITPWAKLKAVQLLSQERVATLLRILQQSPKWSLIFPRNYHQRLRLLFGPNPFRRCIERDEDRLAPVRHI
jgi:hypothetical protein